MSKQPFAMVLYALGALCLLIPLFGGLLLALNDGRMSPEIFSRYLPAAACVWVGLVACGLLIGLGTLMEKDAGMPRKLQTMLAEIQAALQAIGRISSQPLSTALIERAEAQAKAPPPAPAPATPAMDPASLERLVTLLEEIRDTSLLNEQQRQKRLTQLTNARRRVAMAKVEEMITTARWHEADALLTNAEHEFTDDALVRAMRQKYQTAREAAEQQALAYAKEAIRDQIALSSWDRAEELATTFQQQNPGEAADALVAQVKQLRHDYTSSVGAELYDEMRANIEQRSWRRAHECAKRLLEKCPEHPKAGHIRNQLEILKGNADTEQRNAMEARIQELIRSKRFADAIELAEELRREFPGSTQAEIAGQLIERLKQRMAEQQVS